MSPVGLGVDSFIRMFAWGCRRGSPGVFPSPTPLSGRGVAHQYNTTSKAKCENLSFRKKKKTHTQEHYVKQKKYKRIDPYHMNTKSFGCKPRHRGRSTLFHLRICLAVFRTAHPPTFSRTNYCGWNYYEIVSMANIYRAPHTQRLAATAPAAATAAAAATLREFSFVLMARPCSIKKQPVFPQPAVFCLKNLHQILAAITPTQRKHTRAVHPTLVRGVRTT